MVDFDGNLVPGYWTGNNIDSSGGFEPTGVQLYEIYYHHTDILGCYNTVSYTHLTLPTKA